MPYLFILFAFSLVLVRGNDPLNLPLESVAVWIDCHDAPPQTTAYFDFYVSSAYGLSPSNYIESKQIASVKKVPLVNEQSAIPGPYVYVHQSKVVTLIINDEQATLQDFQGVASYKDFSHPGITKRATWRFNVQGTSTETKSPSIQVDFVVQFIFGEGSNSVVKYLRYPGGNAVGKTYLLHGSGSGSSLSFNADDFISNPSGFPVNGSSQSSSDYYSPTNPPEQEPNNTKKTGAPLHKTTLPRIDPDSGPKRNTGT